MIDDAGPAGATARFERLEGVAAAYPYGRRLRVLARPDARSAIEAEARAIEAAFVKAYRWQYIQSGAQHPQFGKVLSSLITENQSERIQAALATLQ